MTSRRTPLNAASVKAALYARVSTDDGRQTVANQVRQLRELALSRDFEIFREYTDEETGASASRASFLALLRDARLRRFRVLLIVVYHNKCRILITLNVVSFARERYVRELEPARSSDGEVSLDRALSGRCSDSRFSSLSS